MKRKLIFALVVIVPVLLFVLIWNFRFEKEISIGDVLRDNGFVELKPPSTLLPPGTWMTVLSTNPFHLSIVCPPENSLGLSGSSHLQSSSSVNSEMMSKLNSTFDFGLGALSRAKGETKFTDLKKVSFKLKNIRILEIPDDIVMKGLEKRAQHCREAIQFRVESKEAVSMVKSVLIADVDFQVEFSRQLETQAAADLKKQLALELDLRLASDQEGSSSLIGRNLIWGIREDARLAKIGLGLPATGGTEEAASVLTAKGPVLKISLDAKRRAFLPTEVVVSYEVLPIRQPSPMSCWATVYTMMKSWKEKSSLSITKVISELGSPWDDYYLQELGLPGGKEREFVNKIKMGTEPPANYTVAAYVQMLQQRGPLWIITGDGISAHARLLVGVYGDWQAEGIKAYEDTTFEFIDPLSGTFEYESGLDFARKFEAEARWLVDGKLDDIELRDQILFWR